MKVKGIAGSLGAAATIAAALAVSCEEPADAAWAQSSVQVTATVTATCLLSATNLDFGSYSGAQVDGSANLTVTCAGGTSPNVIANMGLHQVAGVRYMAYNADSIAYGLYSNAARTVAFPTTTPGVGAASTGVTTITVYGRIPAGQNPTSGSYTDIVDFTVTF